MERKDIQEVFGNNLRKYRVACGKSQEELALDANISPIYLGILERGQKCPSIEILLKLSTVMQIRPTLLLDIDSETSNTDEAYYIVKYALKLLPETQKVKFAQMFEALVKVYINDL